MLVLQNFIGGKFVSYIVTLTVMTHQRRGYAVRFQTVLKKKSIWLFRQQMKCLKGNMSSYQEIQLQNNCY